jgi:ribosomal protein S18 acetylase RimI-like enzyme
MPEPAGKNPDNTIQGPQQSNVTNPVLFTCVALSPDDVEAAARLYTEVFVRDEPTTRWHRITEDNFLPFARAYVQFCEKEGMSFIAQEEGTGKVIGFIFCHDLALDLDALGPDIREYLSRFDATIRLIDALEENYRDPGAMKPGMALHVYQLGISREFRNRSVSTALILTAISFARERGFKQIVTECTGPQSCSSFGNCGFTPKGSIEYSSFLIDGIAFFNGLEGRITLMVRDL